MSLQQHRSGTCRPEEAPHDGESAITVFKGLPPNTPLIMLPSTLTRSSFGSSGLCRFVFKVREMIKLWRGSRAEGEEERKRERQMKR